MCAPRHPPGLEWWAIAATGRGLKGSGGARAFHFRQLQNRAGEMKRKLRFAEAQGAPRGIVNVEVEVAGRAAAHCGQYDEVSGVPVQNGRKSHQLEISGVALESARIKSDPRRRSDQGLERHSLRRKHAQLAKTGQIAIKIVMPCNHQQTRKAAFV